MKRGHSSFFHFIQSNLLFQSNEKRPPSSSREPFCLLITPNTEKQKIRKFCVRVCSTLEDPLLSFSTLPSPFPLTFFFFSSNHNHCAYQRDLITQKQKEREQVRERQCRGQANEQANELLSKRRKRRKNRYLLLSVDKEEEEGKGR